MKTDNNSFKKSDHWEAIKLYSGENSAYMPITGGMVKMINDLWGGRPEFEEVFSKKEINYLNENYFVFLAIISMMTILTVIFILIGKEILVLFLKI